MGKGDDTRLAVLDEAFELARRVGLGGLTIGTLADQTQLSKSGLFAHFKSKEALQIQVLEHARARFEEVVARPTLRVPRGEPRVRALFERWLAWDLEDGGCPFIAASSELDDQPGPVRDQFVRDQRDSFDMVATIFRTGVAEGHFRADADADQFVQDFCGVMLAVHQRVHLLGDAAAPGRARRTFERLLEDARS
jgi:AcrR family transcriptional regulator